MEDEKFNEPFSSQNEDRDDEQEDMTEKCSCQDCSNDDCCQDENNCHCQDCHDYDEVEFEPCQEETQNDEQCDDHFDENIEEEDEKNSGCQCDKNSDGQTCQNEECKCKEQNSKEKEYLALAQQLQADFENYRRHAVEDIKAAKINGQASVIEVFLPCLDTFKEAKKSISDQNILDGINMIEDKIINALSSLGVEKIPSVGEIYDPHKHEAIVSYKDESKENNIILDEYQAGYSFAGKIIRYAKVIVNKLD